MDKEAYTIRQEIIVSLTSEMFHLIAKQKKYIIQKIIDELRPKSFKELFYMQRIKCSIHHRTHLNLC